MRDSMKMTVKYQFIFMLLMQVAASGVTFVFGLVAFWYFTNIPVVKEILSVVLIAVNFAMLYIYAKKFAILDNKPYTPIKPSKVKGALFGVAISCVTVILMIMFKFIWANYSGETGLIGVIPTVLNFVFYYWSFPYNGIMGLSQGVYTIYSAAAMIIVPILATTIGYIFGCKKIEISEKFEEFMYEQE